MPRRPSYYKRRAADRRLKAAKFPTIKVLESFDFKAQPSVNKPLVLELMRCAYIDKRENLLLVGSTGTGKTHLAPRQALTHPRTSANGDSYEGINTERMVSAGTKQARASRTITGAGHSRPA